MRRGVACGEMTRVAWGCVQRSSTSVAPSRSATALQTFST